MPEAVRTVRINRPAADVWKRVGKYCDIGEWFRLNCTITSGKDGEVGAVRSVASEVLVTLNAATVVQPYLPTRYWLAWIDFFRQPVFWRDIQRGFGIQAVYVVVFLAAAWANFSTKDITA